VVGLLRARLFLRELTRHADHLEAAVAEVVAFSVLSARMRYASAGSHVASTVMARCPRARAAAMR